MSDLFKDKGLSQIEISQAFIAIEDRFLMQLRDFKPSIVYPGHWGFFAGHSESGESAEETMWREIEEELSWKPQNLNFLGDIMVEGNRRIHAFQCQLDCKLEELVLQEGQEIGSFSTEEIIKKSLFSQKWKKYYPISPVSAKVFHNFIGILS